MGSQLCKDTQHDRGNQLRDMGSIQKPTLNCCYTPPKPSSKLQDQIIGPIQFSDIGTPQNTPDRAKTKQDNASNTNISANFQQNAIQAANSDHETNQNNKQYKTTTNTVHKTYSNEKRQISRLVSSPNFTDIKMSIVEFQKINVPFSVIRLIIKPQILKLIKIVDRDFDKVHGDHRCQTFHTWKLHQKGFYYNQLSNGSSIIITDQYYYQGNLANQFTKANGKGSILIDEHGAFQGEFREGLANGYGQYISLNGKKKYKGTWKNGMLQNGSLQTDIYKYQGELKNCLPHGKGVLQIFGKKITYKGLFVDGLFQGKGQYQCQQYRYQGHFKKGKKDGQGELRQKQRLASRQQSNIKFRAPRIFSGCFKQDVIIRKKDFR